MVTVLVVDQHEDGQMTSGTRVARQWSTALKQQGTVDTLTTMEEFGSLRDL